MEQDTVLIVAFGVVVVAGLFGVMYWARGSNADPLINLLVTDPKTASEANAALEAEGIYVLRKTDSDSPAPEAKAVLQVRASDHARAVVALQDVDILPR